MSAPPLPEAFGNYALGDFVEVASPSAISWWPQTGGWLLVGLLLLWFALRLGWRRGRHWYRNRYRREAATRLRRLGRDSAGPDLVADVNRLLKLAAMAAYSRERVASLSGRPWIDFLNEQCQPPPFTAAQGELLAEGPYGGDIDPDAAGALVAAGLDWLLRHREAEPGV